MANYDPHLLSRFRGTRTQQVPSWRTYTRPAARERELLPSEMTMGALVDLRDEITSRIATYRQPGVPVRFEDRVALEMVMAEIEVRESLAAVAKR